MNTQQFILHNKQRLLSIRAHVRLNNHTCHCRRPPPVRRELPAMITRGCYGNLGPLSVAHTYNTRAPISTIHNIHPYGEAVLILVLFRVLFLVLNEAKECSTPNSTPLVGVPFVVLHSNGVPFGVPFGVRQLFKLALRLALICRSLVLNGVLKAVPNGVLKGVLFAVLHSKRSVVCGV